MDLGCTVPVWVDYVEAQTTGLFGGRLFHQHGVAGAIVFRRPDTLVVFANLRYLSYWAALVLCRVLRIRVFSHGQGSRHARSEPTSQVHVP